MKKFVDEKPSYFEFRDPYCEGWGGMLAIAPT